jgi:hypothetical protein
MKILRNRPQLVVDQELRGICESILAEGKSAVEWDEVELDDGFRFSYAEVTRIAAGELTHLDMREPG